MKYHFSLSFQAAEHQLLDVGTLVSQLAGGDFDIAATRLNHRHFSVQFSRDGDDLTEMLDLAKRQVKSVVPSAELVAMDMSDQPPSISAVDDITKLVIYACQIFGSPDLAHTWLNQPQKELAGQVPKLVMDNAEGRTEVSRVLTALKAN